ncbi:ABC transporter ATP-binding protein [Caulobacter sp. CCUG 60055]|uniref:ATP-binding cassette domain-containing protein n=1 Tax=Caulobacter sp. CCUG 60055 TaxID=2100090 RepID=UPI001FA7740B|nr:ABC transporter ATP-binding protein [Caulobacter sp. CCUG 60055]MBQ1542081.1 ABC transporter ATP-binding protein [Caulobacteraceae bacterium]MCI3180206.1 ABC transporter ATP-binding protein [Caulobacter sp. CCUG 60055]
MGEAMIELEGIGKDFGGGAVLDGVDLRVASGQFVALIGGSGAGKTTLLKTINGLIVPDRGAARVDGRPVAGAPGHELRRSIGYVFQDVGLFPHMTVAENIGVTPRLLGWTREEIAARVEELLALVALPADHASRPPSALSGGQRQRVGVARALAARPRLMLMDEPFGALDPVIRDALGADYRRLHDGLGLTTVMVTHDVTEALLLADRIVVLGAGRVVADGPPAAMLADRTPSVRALMDAPRRQAERLSALLAEAGHG